MDCHLRYVHLCFVQRKFEEFYTVVSLSLMNHRILECFRARFIIAFQNDSAKSKIFDETNKK